MCREEGVGRGMAVHASITEQTKMLRSTNKAHGKLTSVNLVYINSVNIGSINKDDISKLLCLSVLFNVTKQYNICMDNNASTKNIRIICYLYLGIIACITVLNITCNIV